jgi:hypothetical protein
MLGPQFDFVRGNPKSMDTTEHTHKVEARNEYGDWVGELKWHPKTGEIKNLFVEANERRQGIARGMWDEANRISQSERGVVTPKHSSDRTDEGDAWAKAVGGKVPPKAPKTTHNWENE